MNGCDGHQFLCVLELRFMATDDFFRAPAGSDDRPASPAGSSGRAEPWYEIEASLTPLFAHRARAGHSEVSVDLFGPSTQLVGAGVSKAGRPRLPIRLMVALLYPKHAYHESDESVVQRWVNFARPTLWNRLAGLMSGAAPVTADRLVAAGPSAAAAAFASTPVRDQTLHQQRRFLSSLGTQPAQIVELAVLVTRIHGDSNLLSVAPRRGRHRPMKGTVLPDE